jgi:hypothetical protein
MLNVNETPLATVPTSDVPATTEAPTVAAPATAKRAKPTAKPVAAKPSKRADKPVPAVATKPEPDTSDRSAERIAARTAIADYYSGAGKSIPFKSASDTFAPLRLDKAPKAATVRQAALLAAMLISGDNIKRNGQFTRGGFIFDGKHVQPETGCLSDMLGRVVHHVNGPLAGREARTATFRVDLAKARAEISGLLGDKLAKQALAKLDSFKRAA